MILDRKLTTFVDNIISLSDTPNDDGLTADQFKAMLDGRTDKEIKTSINGIIDDLSSAAEGSSGADQIGASAIVGVNGTTVKGQLSGLKELINQATLGQITDASITDAKLGAGIKIGALADLTTTDKTNIVGAINEINALATDIPNQTYITEKAKSEDVATSLALKADITYTDTQIASVASGSPKAVYATVAALTSAIPAGDTNIYLVTADGKWYYWNGSVWTAGGVYQGTSLAAASTTLADTGNLFAATNVEAALAEAATTISTNGADGAVTYKKTNFLKLDTTLNMFDGVYTTGLSIASGGLVSSSDATRKIAVIPILPNTTYSLIRTDSPTNFFKVFTHTAPTFAVGTNLDGAVEASLGGVDKYTFTSGASDVLLCAFVTYTGETPFLQVVQGTQSVFTCNEYPIVPNNMFVYKKTEVYNKAEVDSLTNNIRRIKVKKTGTQLDIYIPSKKNTNYLHYVYKYIENVPINMAQWKVYTIEVVNSLLVSLYPFQTDIEWEGVVKETGAVDFIGGYHGDETNVLLNVMVDGVEKDINGADFDIVANNEIKIVNKSTINRCNIPNDNLFTRYKVSTWNIDNYIVENKWIALQAITLDTTYLTMMSLPIVSNSADIAKYARYDVGFIKQPTIGDAIAGSCLYPSADARVFEMWSDNFYGKVESIADYDKYSHLTIGDRSQANIMKAYFNLANDYEIAVNEELKCKSIFTFIF